MLLFGATSPPKFPKVGSVMSFMVKMIICAWGTVLAMVAICALNESGRLLEIHDRLGRWLRTVAPASVVKEFAGTRSSSAEREMVA